MCPTRRRLAPAMARSWLRTDRTISEAAPDAGEIITRLHPPEARRLASGGGENRDDSDPLNPTLWKDAEGSRVAVVQTRCAHAPVTLPFGRVRNRFFAGRTGSPF